MARGGDAFGQRRIEPDFGPALLRAIDLALVRPGRDGRGLPAGEAGLDRGFDGIGIEIADHDQRGVGGNVVPRPERAQRIGGGGIERGHGADRQPGGIGGVGVEEGKLVFEIGPLVTLPVAQFRQDHAAFARHGFGREGQLARGLAHQHQRGIEQGGIGAWQIEHVERLFEPGLRVGVRAERQAVAFEQADHLAFGNVGAAVEGHVFDEMGKAAFLRAFVQRSGSHVHPHQRGAGGRGVAPDHIAHAVGQLAEAIAGFGREIALLEGPIGLGGAVPRRMGQRGRCVKQQAGGQQEQGTARHHLGADPAASWLNGQ
jgi:hypothetical protein